jgi:hypothetical protein
MLVAVAAVLIQTPLKERAAQAVAVMAQKVALALLMQPQELQILAAAVEVETITAHTVQGQVVLVLSSSRFLTPILQLSPVA